ncbi:hypothetical protein GR160_10860 [Flavobacterium sp. Sd200]|uniref:hypothetical protein n=1 Tax=Flavobacterium sp. Sd200 TaxID=2692211 RepID=UPI001367ED72|nr:hypothetical protein [Flavobacterium sp. Sd200]MXN91727.1 hypothetical protein [Flavobacterium sp. Sd200]
MLRTTKQMLCILLVITWGYGQEKHLKYSDSLIKKNYSYLQERIDNAPDTPSGLLYTKGMMAKAANEQNHGQLFQGYKNSLHFEQAYVTRLKYADSMLYESQYLGEKIKASALLTKGAVHYNEKKYKFALDCYLEAEGLLSADPENILYYKAQYCIAQVKYYLGYYPQAIKLLIPCLHNFKEEEPRGYINTLHLLGLCYNRNGDYTLCSTTNKFGIAEASRLEESDMLPYFLHSEGVNQYFIGNYALALKHLKSTLPFLSGRGDYANISVAWCYIGKVNDKLGHPYESLLAYRNVYNIFSEHHYIRPDGVQALYALAQQSKADGDIENQLQYTAALLSADSLMHTDFRYLSDRLHTEYDTAQLQKEKNTLQQRLKSGAKDGNWRYALWTLLVAVGVCIIIKCLKRYRWTRQRVKPEQVNDTPTGFLNSRNQTVTLRKDLAIGLLEKLEKFERQKKYLGKDMNLAMMAKYLDTNTKYVSMLIHEYRGKKTPEYINDLKIDHLVGLFGKDKKFQNYTHSALAAEIGLSSTKSLHKAFLNRIEITLPQYLENLQATKGQQEFTDSKDGN